jgi:hypothetical protein
MQTIPILERQGLLAKHIRTCESWTSWIISSDIKKCNMLQVLQYASRLPRSTRSWVSTADCCVFPVTLEARRLIWIWKLPYKVPAEPATTAVHSFFRSRPEHTRPPVASSKRQVTASADLEVVRIYGNTYRGKHSSTTLFIDHTHQGPTSYSRMTYAQFIKPNKHNLRHAVCI